VHEEVLRSQSLEALGQSRFAIVSIASQYTKPILTPYLQSVMFSHIIRIVEAPMLDLSTDPTEVSSAAVHDHLLIGGFIDA
jgi:Ras GTPase-activating-like protein IQGAP2/3